MDEKIRRYIAQTLNLIDHAIEMMSAKGMPPWLEEDRECLRGLVAVTRKVDPEWADNLEEAYKLWL